jgi:uncharacterized membrane protein
MSAARRVELLDLLRGAVIIWMALDHTRDFFQPAGLNPTNLATTSAAFFATRWVTHLCAPTFVFLAGVGMGLQKARKGTPPDLLRFFATRGLWLMFLEVTWVTFSWYFDYHATHLGILWGIGGAMVLATPFTKLAPRWQALLGALPLLALSLFEPAEVRFLSAFIQPFSFKLAGHPVYSTYVIVPWWSVMMLGMAGASLFDSDDKRGRLRALGVALLVAFGVMRAAHFGDPVDWEPHERGPAFTFMAFLKLSKYPPSLAYLCATLGVSFTLGSFLLAVPDRLRGVLRTFGRVPLFYYLLHLPFLHLLGVLHAQVRYGASSIPKTASLDLFLIYGVWAAATVALYFPCRAYDRAKTTHRKPWMRYL